MNTNVQKRVITIACRKGIAIMTDNMKPQNTLSFDGNGDSQLACLMAINNLLGRMPKGVRFNHSVALLLPQQISFLAYKDTREYWLANGSKKNGEPVSQPILAEIKKMNSMLMIHNSNLQMFNQTMVKSALYKTYIRETWICMDKVVAPEKKETVDESSAF